MGSRVNIGSFRDRITVKFVNTQTTGAMGGRVLSYDDFTLNADVRQVKADQSIQFGLDALKENYIVVCRPPTNGRPHLVEYNGETFTVIHTERDKVNQFLRMIITIKR